MTDQERLRLMCKAWHIETRNMIDLYKITPLALDIKRNGIFIPFDDDIIVLRCIGVRDKNGFPIFEKDLLRFINEESSKDIYVVPFMLITDLDDVASLCDSEWYDEENNVITNVTIVGNDYQGENNDTEGDLVYGENETI